MAVKTDLMRIEVAYARPDCQWLLARAVPAGTTARQAALASGLDQVCPEIDLGRCPLGVFGQPVAGDRVLREGERVEIYRPLQRDPREVRRELAVRGLTMGPAGRSA